MKKNTDPENVRLAIIPPGKIQRSIDGRIRPRQARQECLSSGISSQCLEECSVTVRHTHARINTIILEVPNRALNRLEVWLKENHIPYERIQKVDSL